MKPLDKLACEEAQYIIDNHASLQQAADHFGRSQSSVHNDMRIRLPKVNPELAAQVDKVLARNFAERTMRAGLATRAKWDEIRPPNIFTDKR